MNVASLYSVKISKILRPLLALMIILVVFIELIINQSYRLTVYYLFMRLNYSLGKYFPSSKVVLLRWSNVNWITLFIIFNNYPWKPLIIVHSQIKSKFPINAAIKNIHKDCIPEISLCMLIVCAHMSIHLKAQTYMCVGSHTQKNHVTHR